MALGLFLLQNCGDSQPAGNPDAGGDATLDGASGAVHITTTSLPNAPAGAVYSAPVAATGGQLPYSWSIVSGPGWLSISPATGQLGGTPTVADVGPVTVTVKVTDTLQQTDTHTYQFNVTTCDPKSGTVTCYTSGADAGAGCLQGTATCNPDGSQGPCVPNNASNDSNHCDSTCTACGSGETCSNGLCQCGGGAECTGTTSCCSGACADLQSDPQNCGNCGNDCNNNPPTNTVHACTAGQCDYSQCLAGAVNCDGVPGCECGDPANHVAGSCNGGSCGSTTCLSGWGGCPSGCSTDFSSTSNCGGCGHNCASGTCVQSADGGAYSCNCAGGYHLCSGSCVGESIQACGASCAICGNGYACQFQGADYTCVSTGSTDAGGGGCTGPACVGGSCTGVLCGTTCCSYCGTGGTCCDGLTCTGACKFC